jgi:uncharacterized protein involved in response to NO
MSTPILAYPFRPFFLRTGIYGAITILAWMAFLLGGLPLPLGWSPLHWHSHEMLFGLGSAAIAGFILTAICNWTGAAPLHNKGLLMLLLLWLIGRIAFWTASYWPAMVIAGLDMAFLFALTVYVTRVLLLHGNKRNLPLALILVLLTLANAFMHYGFVDGQTQWLQWGEQLALGLVTLMMVMIGGRIIPLFTGNWLRNRGATGLLPRSYPALDAAALLSTLLVILVDLFGPTHEPGLLGAIALVAALVNALRLLGWVGWRTAPEPLLWILHLGYGWIVLGLLLKGLAAFAWVAPSAWLHALGAGAMGTLILGVMSRVALGHTGRPLLLPRWGLLIYVAISLAAVARVLAALDWLDYQMGLVIAASGWTIAFGVFTWIYWPILTSPRVDGRPG